MLFAYKRKVISRLSRACCLLAGMKASLFPWITSKDGGSFGRISKSPGNQGQHLTDETSADGIRPAEEQLLKCRRACQFRRLLKVQMLRALRTTGPGIRLHGASGLRFRV
jgi:hypothetical protein